ncbi:MAG: hypothetical protein HGA25_07330 [Clostridiales bacterium]|nr:hypothetical protein [Clostridiales bacterium]
MKKIVKNCIMCNSCKEILISQSRHDYKECSCGTVAVDGGTDYLRRAYKNSLEDYEELSEYEED